MIRISMKNILFAAALTLMFFSCKAPGELSKGTAATDKLYGDTLITDSASLADMPWEQLFTDPRLRGLIKEGLANNPDLQLAAQRVIQAEAYFAQGKASLFPSVTAQGGAGYVHRPKTLYPDGPRDVKDYQLNLQASWEVDVWGKLRSSKRAAYASLLASDAGEKAVRTGLIAAIATTYYSLMGLDEQLKITRQTVETNIDLVETMKLLKSSGQVTGAAVVQTEALRYAAEVTIPDLEQTIRETENTMCLLLGRTPGKIERGRLEEQKLPPVIKTGVPVRLLDNRPDVMEAEYNLMNAYELSRNARAYFYPALTITASAGLESTDLNTLLDPDAFVANLIGGLTAPLFNKRTNVTRLKVARSQQEQALISFRNSLLTAGQEVNDAMGQYQASEKKSMLREQQLSALEKSVSYSKELLTYGSATYTEVLNAQQSLLGAQLSQVNDHLQQLNAALSLYRALGGGWKD